MAHRQDDEAIERLIGRAVSYAEGNRRIAARLLINSFVRLAGGDDQTWASEVLFNLAADLSGLDDYDEADAAVH
jgi:hypothetical protein